jgi:hypothetical protein
MKALPVQALLESRCVFVLLCAAAALSGCANGGGGAQVHGSMYMGVGYYNPWYWGPCCDDVVVIGPPDGSRPRPPDGAGSAPRPEHPIANPPPAPAARPVPAAAAPRPVAMPRGGGGRRR